MLSVIGIWLFELLWCLSNLLIKPRMLSCNKMYKMEAASGKFDEAAYIAIKKNKFNIRSSFGYILSCELLTPKKIDTDNRIAIICHGLGYSRFSSIKYAEMFMKMGFKVILYDHRNHGMSGKAHTSMGHYEKYDLKKVVDWCVETFGAECKIVTHGESMGASTVLLHLEIDNRVKCAIADCAYSDLILLLRHQLKQYYHLPEFFIPIESCLTYLRAGFWYREVSPMKAISNTDTPILFIHGKDDTFVPTYMSRYMYSCKKDKKAIYLVAGAKHAESYCKNKKEYEKYVEIFINRFLS